jgi:hypothetical protein
MDHHSGIINAENIEESPTKHDTLASDLGQRQIYQFTYNEHNAKSVISSTDRKRPSQQ